MSNFRREIDLLLSGIKCGDKTKLKILFSTTYNHLKVIAYKYAINKNDTEDILIESYIKIFKYINSFDMSKDGYNWLCKIVQNVSYDFNNKLSPFEELNFNKESPFNDNNDLEELSILSVELSKLSKYEQELIYLRFWENLSYSEIASKLNGKKSTIHKQINAILKNLYKNLKN